MQICHRIDKKVVRVTRTQWFSKQRKIPKSLRKRHPTLMLEKKTVHIEDEIVNKMIAVITIIRLL